MEETREVLPWKEGEGRARERGEKLTHGEADTPVMGAARNLSLPQPPIKIILRFGATADDLKVTGKTVIEVVRLLLPMQRK